MLVKTITIDNVDLELLDRQRRDLYAVISAEGVDKTKRDNLDGLMGLLDYICDKYEVLAYSTDGEEL